MSQSASIHYINDYLTSVEHAFVCDWLNISRPDKASKINLNEHYEPLDAFGMSTVSGSKNEISLRDASHGGMEYSIRNAVARLVLSSVQYRLPQWALSPKKGELICGRHYEQTQNRKISVLPQFLFEINWADSGPGFSWPEAYYATFLPGYDIFIVTLSQDSTDVYGFEDMALGWFDPEEGIVEGSHRVITDAWGKQFTEYDQQPWEYLFDTGLVSSGEANEWASEVWPELRSFQEEAK